MYNKILHRKIISKMYLKYLGVLVSQSCPTLCDPIDHRPTRLLCPWNTPGKNAGVGCHALLQGIFPTNGSNPGLLHCWQILYHLSHLGIPVLKYLEVTKWYWCLNILNTVWDLSYLIRKKFSYTCMIDKILIHQYHWIFESRPKLYNMIWRKILKSL